MQKAINTKPETKTTKAIKAVKSAANKAKPTKAPKPFVHAHSEAGVTGKHYAGLSGYLNANRKPRVAIGGDHKYNRTTAQLTPRTIATLTAIRNAYSLKQFNARGFDNAVLAMLHSAGLIRRVADSGTDATINGATYAGDGATPLQFAVTSAGNKFGKA